MVLGCLVFVVLVFPVFVFDAFFDCPRKQHGEVLVMFCPQETRRSLVLVS